MKIPKSKSFKEAVSFVKKLQKAGFKAHLAGGCVRDMVLGKEPKDFDISTSAKPEEIENLRLGKTIAVGKQFGVIIVVGKSGQYETATFRGESDYRDKRRPSKVFWTSAKEDAIRRDFTINGLFYDPIKKELIDYVGGQKDLDKKVIRFIGDPVKRIREDALRILRAFRFKNTLNFKYDPKTKEALEKNAKLIKYVSPERIKAELDLMLKSENRTKAIEELSDFGILKRILPEIEKTKGAAQPPNFHAEGDVFVHTLLSLRKLPKDAPSEVIWAILLHDIGKPKTSKYRIHPKLGRKLTFYNHQKLGAKMAEEICDRLHFSKKEKDMVVFLVLEHIRHVNIVKMKLARQRKWAQHPWFPLLLMVWKADGEASLPPDMGFYNSLKKLYDEEQKRPKPPKMLLNGNEIMKLLKLSEGPKVGRILHFLEEAQLEDRVKTKKEAKVFVKKVKI